MPPPLRAKPKPRSVYIDDALWAVAVQEAYRLHQTISQYIRDCIELASSRSKP